MTDIPFEPFAKIYRWSREIIITEKIDGTNSQVYVGEDGEVRAGSRNRWLTPDDDNFGLSAWARDHAEELRGLGPGRHFGEWWGQGIQRGYGLAERRFSLFNVSRWGESRPACCHVVPVIRRGILTDGEVQAALDRLRVGGSLAAPGFMRPEGIVIFHTASGYLFKKTLERDEEPKGKRAKGGEGK
jgi:hypothetical protein